MATLAQLIRLTHGTASLPPVVVLGDLTLSSLVVGADLEEGAFVADIIGKTPGSVISIADDDDQFVLSPGQTHLLKGPTPSSPGPLALGLLETDPRADNSPKLNEFDLVIEAGSGTVSLRMGSLSRAGVGSGVYVGGETITDGNSLGHFELLTGILCVTTAGDTANLSGGPYVLTLDSGSIVTVTVDANTWSVSTQAEWDAIIVQSAATLSGKTIAVRPLSSGGHYVSGVNGTAARLRRGAYGGLTIRADDGNNRPIFDKFYLRGTRGVTFRGIDTVPDSAIKFRIVGEAANNAGDIIINRCVVRGQPLDPNGDFSAAGSYPNPDLITTGGSTGYIGTLEITDNEILWCARGININSRSGTHVITSGNRIRFFYDDGINTAYDQADVPWYCEDNVISEPIGLSSDADGPHVDAIRGIGSIVSGSDWHVYINRNRIFHGDSRGAMQGILLSDFKTVNGGGENYFIAQVVGNFYANNHNVCLQIENAKSCEVLGNTVVSNGLDGAATVTIKVGSGSTHATFAGEQRISNNVSEGYSIGGPATTASNITLGRGGAVIPYATAFDGPTWDPMDLDDVMAFFSRKAGGPADLGEGQLGAGAIGSGVVTWATTVPGSDGVNVIS